MVTREGERPPRRRWLALGGRLVRLLCRPTERTSDLVRKSYNGIACGYDDAWTHHMRDQSLAMLDVLAPPAGAGCLDLACGTGFVTRELAKRSGGQAIGLDSSAGMLAVASRQHGDKCTFVQAEAVGYLRSLPRHSVDVVTCAWGLGYTQPWRIIREAAVFCAPVDASVS